MHKLETPQAKLKRLKVELHYYQAQARIEARWLKNTRARCKAIGAAMRECQRQIIKRPRRTP